MLSCHAILMLNFTHKFDTIWVRGFGLSGRLAFSEAILKWPNGGATGSISSKSSIFNYFNWKY